MGIDKYRRDSIAAIIAGYEEREREYNEKLEELAESKITADYSKFRVKGGGGKSPVETAVELQLELDKRYNSRCVFAVRQARNILLIAKYGERRGEKLFNIILENIRDPYRNTYDKLNAWLDFRLCRTDFFKLKKEIIEFVSEFIENN